MMAQRIKANIFTPQYSYIMNVDVKLSGSYTPTKPQLNLTRTYLISIYLPAYCNIYIQ